MEVYMKKYRWLVFIQLIFFVFSMSGCGKNSEKGKIIATVNGAPLLLKELQFNIAQRSKRNLDFKITPEVIEEELNIMIEKKLVIQEAMKKKLTNDEKFVRTVRTFWEQTLIKQLFELKKNSEWKDYIFVNEEEIKNYYQKLQYRVTFKLIKAKDQVEADSILKKAQKGEVKNWDEVIGPVKLEEIANDFQAKAFDMTEGEIKIFYSNKEPIIISLVKKETVPQPPLQELYEYIKALILKEKSRKVMREWIEDSKSRAKIQVNKETLDNFIKQG